VSPVGQAERVTQNRVIALFRDELGYRYLGDWSDREGNSNIEEGLLTAHLMKAGYSAPEIGATIFKLRTEADNPNRDLYDNNHAVYSLLRYGVDVKVEAGAPSAKVHLINWSDPHANDFAITYIEADPSRTISPFGDMPLLGLIVKSGIAAAISSMPAGVRSNEAATAEVIENNVRKTIIKEQLTDPAFYDRMSRVLDEIIAARKARAIDYEEYLKRIAELAKKVQAGQDQETPAELSTPGRRAIFNCLKAWKSDVAAEPGPDALDRALRLDAAIRAECSDGWRGFLPKEQEIKQAMYNVLGDVAAVEALFPIIKQHREY